MYLSHKQADKSKMHYVIIILMPSHCSVVWPMSSQGLCLMRLPKPEMGLVNFGLLVRSPLEHKNEARSPEKGLRVWVSVVPIFLTSSSASVEVIICLPIQVSYANSMSWCADSNGVS